MIASLFLAFTLTTLHFPTFTRRPVLSVFSSSLFVFNCTCLCFEEIKATSSAKSRSSSYGVNFHRSPVPSSFTVCLITQSIMSRKRKPDIVHPCLTPVVSSNHSEVASSSTTAHSKPSYSALNMLTIFCGIPYWAIIIHKEGDIGGFWTPQYRKKNSKNTAIPQKKSPNTATPQYRVNTRCNPEISTLYVTLSANNIEITIKSLLMDVKPGSFRFRSFRQNKQNV